MLDNELIKIFRPILLQGFIDYGVGAVNVRQQYQPTQTGTEKLPVISFFKVSDSRFGMEERKSYYDSLEMKQKESEVQLYHSVFQFSALAVQNPADINSITSSDLINIASSIMQNNDTIKKLYEQNVSFKKITEIRNIPFFDDRDQNEFISSFDITFQHIQERIIDIDYITDVTSGLYPI